MFEDIRARAEAATTGPWIITSDGHIRHGQTGGLIGVVHLYDTDTKFVAHAREDIPALLAHIEAQQREIEELKAENVRCEVQNFAIQKERDEVVELIRGKCEYCSKRKSCHARQGAHIYCWEMRGRKGQE